MAAIAIDAPHSTSPTTRSRPWCRPTWAVAARHDVARCATATLDPDLSLPAGSGSGGHARAGL